MFITNNSLAHLSQSINLYCWPLQLNLFLSTIAAIFYLSDSQPLPIFIISILFLFILFGSFALMVKDTVRYLSGLGLLAFSGFSVIYFAAVLVIIHFVFLSPAFQQSIQLAAALS